MSDRLSLGQHKVGIPQQEVVEALIAEIDMQAWSDFNREIAMYYMDRMMFSELVKLLQSALSDENLEALDKKKIHWLNISLIRDHFRHNADLLRPVENQAWVESLFDSLLEQFDIANSMYEEFESKFDLVTFNAQWAKKLSEPFGMRSDKLFVAHAAIVTGPRDELSAGLGH